jgi:hypothetical protein
VEAVGYISTYPGYGATTTTSAFNQTSATALPNVGDILANYTSTQPVIPIANDTRVDCYSYIYFDNLTQRRGRLLDPVHDLRHHGRGFHPVEPVARREQ